MSFFDWISLNIPRFVAIIFGSASVYFFMVSIISAKRSETAEHPASFFPLSEIVSRTSFRTFCLLYAGSVTLIYAALAFQGGSFLGALKEVLASYVSGANSSIGASEIRSAFQKIPAWLDPIFILVFFMVLFSTRLSKLVAIVRDLFASGAGLYALVEDQCLLMSRELLEVSNGDFRQAYEKIAVRFREPPVPPAYAGRNDIMRLGYQLIWTNAENIKEKGPVRAFQDARKHLGLGGSKVEPRHIDASHLLASSFLFFVLMVCYVIVVPMLGGPARRLGAEWPDPNGAGWSTLVILIMSETLTLIVPLTLALTMYPARRRAYQSKESQITSFFIIASVQWIVAFIVQELFNVIDVAYAAAHGQASYTFAVGRIHVSAFLYSLAPIVAFGLITQLRSRITKYGIAAFIVSSVVGVHFSLCDAIYEYYCPTRNFLFIHQALLGLWIMLAFFMASSVNKHLQESAPEF